MPLQRRARPQISLALRVPAAEGHLRRWRSVRGEPTPASVAPPCLCPSGARNAAPPITRTGSRVVPMSRLLLVAVLLGTTLGRTLAAATPGGTLPGPLPLFPPTNWWNVDVSGAPLDPGSGAFIT